MRLSGSVKLRCALPSGSALGGAGGGPFLLRPSALRFASASAPHLLLRGGLGLGLQRRFRRADLGEPLLLVGDPLRHLVAAPAAVELVLLRIGGLGGRQPAVDLRLQLRLALLHARIAHRLVLGGIGLDLRAVERDVPELHQPGRATQLENLHEQLGQSSQVPFAEVGDGAEVRRVPGNDHHEVGALGARLGDAPRGVEAAGVGVEQQRRHQRRVERRLAEVAIVAGLDLRKVEALANQRHYEARLMILRHVVLHARWQQLCLVDLPAAVVFAHAPGQNPTRARKSTDYSDKLLGDLHIQKLDRSGGAILIDSEGCFPFADRASIWTDGSSQ
jgi:hypothetical protein